jgi:hypothetical protein
MARSRASRRPDWPGGSPFPRDFWPGTSQEFCLIDGDQPADPRQRITDDTLLRTNGGKCDAAGRFFAGMAAQDGRWGTGALYRLHADHSVTPCCWA